MTKNHNYATPEKGQQNWHIPLNENFRKLDKDIEVRDTEANLSDYEPAQDAKYLATDTKRIFLGDGEQWNEFAAFQNHSTTAATEPVSAANVTAYGAVGDGSTDDREAIQAAIDSEAGTILFPDGDYRISDGLTLAGDGQASNLIAGGTASLTAVAGASFTRPMIDVGDVSRVSVRHLDLNGNSSAAVGVSVGNDTSDPVQQMMLENVVVRNTTSHGYEFYIPINSAVDTCRAVSVGGDGFHMEGGTSTGFRNTYANNPDGDGYYLNGGNTSIAYVPFVGCAADDATNGYVLDGEAAGSVSQVSFTSCGAEAQTKRGLWAKATYAVSVDTFYTATPADSNATIDCEATRYTTLDSVRLPTDPASAPALRVNSATTGGTTRWAPELSLIACDIASYGGDISKDNLRAIGSGFESRMGDGPVVFAPIDLTNTTGRKGAVAFHDGTGENTTGPAFHDGTSWTSLVDGTKIS